MPVIMFTTEDEAFIASSLEKFDPDESGLISLALDSLGDDARRPVVHYMRRHVRAALETGMALRAVGETLEAHGLMGAAEAVRRNVDLGTLLAECTVPGWERFDDVKAALYGDEDDDVLNSALLELVWGAAKRGLGPRARST